MSELCLYTTALSANGRKVLALVEHLGLDAEIRETNVYAGAGQTESYLAINPQGKIPTLVEGDFRLSESNAILQYLADRHPERRLLDRDLKPIAPNMQTKKHQASSHAKPKQQRVETDISALGRHSDQPQAVPSQRQSYCRWRWQRQCTTRARTR